VTFTECQIEEKPWCKQMKTKIGILKEIDRLGRIVIPKELRERFGLSDRVEVVATEEGILIRNQEYKLVKTDKKNS